jgi:hypothetical protein
MFAWNKSRRQGFAIGGPLSKGYNPGGRRSQPPFSKSLLASCGSLPTAQRHGSACATTAPTSAAPWASPHAGPWPPARSVSLRCPPGGPRRGPNWPVWAQRWTPCPPPRHGGTVPQGDPVAAPVRCRCVPGGPPITIPRQSRGFSGEGPLKAAVRVAYATLKAVSR